MVFEDFDARDWEFFEAAATAGLDCPGLDGDSAEEALAVLSEFGPKADVSTSQIESLCEAFDIGWNVATENGQNDLAKEFAHVKFAVSSARPGVMPISARIH